MKKILTFFTLLFLPMLFLASCQDDDHELGALLNKSDVKFRVMQDRSADAGGNTVVLINETPGTISMWDFETGTSTRMVDTVRYAFKGQYTIQLSVLTAGGKVDLDPVTIQVTEDNLNYVNDPLWTFLTGGVGKEKTWILDYGKHGVFDGPLYFYEPLTTWQNMQDGTAKLGWAPAYADNSWIIPAADMASTMTFSLKGGPFFRTHKVSEAKDETGTYSFNAKEHTISTSGGTILRSPGFIANASNWTSNLVVLSLTEKSLQIGVRRTNNEGDYLYVWNYISKEYADNYVPVDAGPRPKDEGFDPTFKPGELLNMLTGGPSSGRVWRLDATGNPIDWIGKGNGWTTGHASSRDWGWNNSWDAAATNSWIRFDRFGGQNYTRSQNGVQTTGTFTIDEATNEITLVGNTLIQNPGSWMNPAGNKLKVVKAFPSDFQSKGIWFGTSYDAAKDEWFAFHYVLGN
ncbi:hypothetical protein ACD591_01685 [Rufibacter glacialis]|uniref:PKD domain-containing protein n=1 Tax=Rufibacter glacialis TaxID=1259555 RepID=A0A5M8QHU6_9BACT|nr:hypothetical protein [Rufibacter glacialis]KAA6435605.1 hypothetical protein FOE74_06585 [Rufibacter glacialis]